MDLRVLRSFCAVAQCGSITKAAEHLQIRQPAVTLHIQELERETGVALLDRSKRPVQLTPAGLHLAELSQPLLRQFASLAVETANFAQLGSLTVASTTEMARNMLLDTVVAYRKAYPETQLTLHSGRLPEVLRMVREREADLGFVPLMGRLSDFRVEELFINERVLLAAKDHPILNEEITRYDQIARWPIIVNAGTRENPSYLEGKLIEAGLDYRVAMRLDHFDAIKRYVAKGVGIAVAPRIILEPDDEETLAIVALDGLLDTQAVGIIMPVDSELSRFAERFVRLLRETIPAHLAPRWS